LLNNKVGGTQSVEQLGIMVQLTAGARDLSLVRSVQISSAAQPVSCPVVTGRSYYRGKADGAVADCSLHAFCCGLDHVEL